MAGNIKLDESVATANKDELKNILTSIRDSVKNISDDFNDALDESTWKGPRRDSVTYYNLLTFYGYSAVNLVDSIDEKITEYDKFLQEAITSTFEADDTAAAAIEATEAGSVAAVGGSSSGGSSADATTKSSGDSSSSSTGSNSGSGSSTESTSSDSKSTQESTSSTSNNGVVALTDSNRYSTTAVYCTKEEFMSLANTAAGSYRSGWKTNIAPNLGEIYDISVAHGLNPVMVLAISCQESLWGDSPCATNNVMGYKGSNGWKNFSSIAECYETVCDRLTSKTSSPVYDLTSVDTIAKNYCNPPESWASAVKGIMSGLSKKL